MIGVRRLLEPAILVEKKDVWQTKYDEKRRVSPGARPESKQYAHPDIVSLLRAMSHGKCFYCEALGRLTVDHHIEVAERPDLAFAWLNLYLACDHCQRKVPNTSIPVTACVDPCDPSMDPADHLEYRAELISYRTERGNQTIQKYRLKQLDNERRRELQRFNEELISLGKSQGWSQISAADRERLQRYAREDAPFSLMFRATLQRHGLL